MNLEETLRQLDVCAHRFPSAVVVPQGETFAFGTWCIKCGEAQFTTYVGEEEEETHD